MYGNSSVIPFLARLFREKPLGAIVQLVIGLVIGTVMFLVMQPLI